VSGDVAVIRHKIIPSLVLVALLAPLPSAGQDAPGVTLEEALLLFAENNLELRVARLGFEEAAGLARQAGAFPNPSFNATHEPLSGAPRSYSETYLTASQRIELSGARGARSEAAMRRADAAHSSYRADSLRLAFEVKRTYAEAVVAQQREAGSRRVAAVFEEALRRARERFADGDISRFTLRRIEAERARYETLLAVAEIETGIAERALALLVTPTGDAPRLVAAGLPAPVPPLPPSQAEETVTIESRPELTAARSEAEAQAAQLRLVRAERVPDVTATGGFKRQSDGLRGGFVGLSVPVPLFDRGAGGVEAAEAGLRTAEQRLALTRRQLENDVQRARERHRALSTRSALVVGDGATDGADDLLDIAMVAYEEGEMELVELLDAAEAAHSTRTDRARLQAELWIAYFDLERALGGFPVPGQEDQP
jgi:cobalt-zinc-cadmium efflux system outer membrane protein